MNVDQVLAELQISGTDKMAKIYQKRGSGPNTYGVSIKDLKLMKKRLGTNQDLAIELWDSEVIDARILACYISDPKLLTKDLVQEWVRDISYFELADIFSGLVAKSSLWKDLMYEWMDANEEYIKQCGYDILSSKLSAERKQHNKSISVTDAKAILEVIKSEIHNVPNRAKHTMNGALISLGSYISECTDMALEIAEDLGIIDVDHGQTGCVTPDAASYIRKTVAYLNKSKN